jgi:hypothetical protein
VFSGATPAAPRWPITRGKLKGALPPGAGPVGGWLDTCSIGGISSALEKARSDLDARSRSPVNACRALAAR